MEPPEDQPPSPPAVPPPPSYPPAPAPTTYAPAPEGAPPYYAQPVAPPAGARKGRGPLIAVILVVVLAIVAVGGYAVGGFVYAQGRIDSATTSYNSVIDHQNKLTDFFNNLTSQINSVDPKNATKDSIAKAKALYQQLVSQSQTAEPQITADDATLASADAQLKENQWLTALSSSAIDKQSTKIGYLRSALGVAKTITHDYIDYGNFNVALSDAINDVLTLDDAANANDLEAVKAAVSALQTDVTKAIALDRAPGLSSQVDSFMHDLQSVAADFAALISAVDAGDQNAATQADNALNADTSKLDGYDYTAIDQQATDFYSGLIDQYNKYINQANNA